MHLTSKAPQKKGLRQLPQPLLFGEKWMVKGYGLWVMGQSLNLQF